MKVKKTTGLFFPLLLLAGALWAGPKLMSVQVKEGQLRATPTFLGAIVANVAYGDRVEVLTEQNNWIEVRHQGKTGWIHTSALTRKQIVLASGDREVGTSASSDELALAGKGFNAQVEAEFKAQNKDIDFTWVDRMEKAVISPQEITAFLKAGEVQVREGGGR